jgi:hypothetical protein
LFCPRCAAPMQRIGSEITCAAGGMGLSLAMAGALLSRFGSHIQISALPPPAGADWYCPACRVPMTHDVKCSECGGTLKDLRYQLVEFHPHGPDSQARPQKP